jgi:hypothetical protein
LNPHDNGGRSLFFPSPSLLHSFRMAIDSPLPGLRFTTGV